MTYDNAGRILKIVNEKFNRYGFPSLTINQNIIPSDNSTLFICSGMQELKSKFAEPDNSTYSSLQSCIRTNDLDSIGDGTHLSSFQMLGNFSFCGPEYQKSCEMWLEIFHKLQIVPDYVTYHPNCPQHQKIWQELGLSTVESTDCEWSDGNIGGYCTEIFKDNIEIGNLVNTSNAMTDVGFGWERLMMFAEHKSRVDETSLFPQVNNYILRDHLRTIELLHVNNIYPDNKGRNFITKKLIRRCLNEESLDFFQDYFKQDPQTAIFKWFADEDKRKTKAINSAKSSLIKHRNKDYQFWKESFGLLPFEIDKLKNNTM